jgi:SET domain
MRITTGPSKIHGRGILAECDLPSGTTITHEEMCEAIIGFNHSCEANLGPVEGVGKTRPFRVTLRDVKKGEELTVDYAVFGAEPKPCLCPKCL